MPQDQSGIVNTAARKLLKREAVLMGVPLTRQELHDAALGDILDVAHNIVHRITDARKQKGSVNGTH